MSGTFPTSPLPSGLTLKSVQPTLVSRTHAMTRQTRTRGGQLWSLSLRYEPGYTRSRMMPLMAFAIAQQGQHGTFDVVPAVLGRPQGVVAGSTVIVSGAHVAGDTTINTSGWATGSGMVAGDLLRFAGHYKTYMVMANVTASGGAATLTIQPPLQAALANSETVTVTDVPIRMAFASDGQSIDLAAGGDVVAWSCELVEAL